MNFDYLLVSNKKKITNDFIKLALPLAILFAIGPFVYTNQALFFSLAVFIILTEAFNIVYGFTGYLPFGFAVFFAIGAYVTAIMIVHLHFPALLAVLVGGLSSVALSFLFSPLLRLSGAYFAISSLAFFEAVYYIFENPTLEHITGGPYGISFIQAYNPNLTYALVSALAVISVIVVVVIYHSSFGAALRAIKDDRFAVELSGINSLRYRNFAWIISTFMAGIAGSLYGWYLGFFYPSGVFDLTQYSVLVIVFVIFGGAGTKYGPVLGTIILFVLYQFLNFSFTGSLQLVFGVILVVLILFLPNGIVPMIRKYTKEVS